MKVVGTVAARVEQNENLKETIGEKNGKWLRQLEMMSGA